MQSLQSMLPSHPVQGFVELGCAAFQSSYVSDWEQRSHSRVFFTAWCSPLHSAVPSFHKSALTIELGRVGKIGHNDFTLLAPFRDAMLQLITDVALPIIWTSEVEVYQVSRTITKQQPEFYFTFNDDVANFTFFAEGDEFAVDGRQTYSASVGGEAVVFPNRHVMLGQRAALMVKKANLIFDEQVRVCDITNASY